MIAGVPAAIVTWGAQEVSTALAAVAFAFVVGVGAAFALNRAAARWAERRRAGIARAKSDLANSYGEPSMLEIPSLERSANVSVIPFTLEGKHSAIAGYESVVRGQGVAVQWYRVDTGLDPFRPEVAFFTYVAVTGNANFPVTVISPRRDGALPGASCAHTLDTESAEFNAAWHVGSDQPGTAHALLYPRVIERLLQPDARGAEVAAQGATLVAVMRGAVTDVKELTRRVELLVDIANLVPGFLRADGQLQGSPSSTPALAKRGSRRAVRVGPWAALGAITGVASFIARLADAASAALVVVIAVAIATLLALVQLVAHLVGPFVRRARNLRQARTRRLRR